MKKILKILGIFLLVVLVVATLVYFFILQYPKLKDNPKTDKWYHITSNEMKSSDGSKYRAFFKKGKENKVLVYFAGGGVSIDEKTARNDTYNTKSVWPDMLANVTMNMGGLATSSDTNPFSDWTVILFPYATGDFHSGTGEFKYTDKDGKEKILYHNGYTNFTLAMEEIMVKAGIKDTDTVVVTGYSAGGWGASLLADDVFSKYFPNTKSKTVLVDSSVALYEDWKNVAENVWKSPQHIVDRIKTNNITLDSLTALHEKYGADVTILFDCTPRDGSLAQVQRYFKNKEIDEETGKMPVEESDADEFQKALKEFVYKLKEQTNAHVFIFDGYDWYGDPRNMTSHTIISIPIVFQKLNDTDTSISEWLENVINGKYEDYGLDLLNKNY
ncbi:pectin acetylesterase-family hydrolase [Clostridium intestinale]|uniref:pectin acetylesterase-family hydrolase n=1 Tax=Clostridium intestinale TaxID=36845 RepID=UPI0028E88481|nr:pectin acetylesterase-family hydrolase [Clostridium intestinale]